MEAKEDRGNARVLSHPLTPATCDASTTRLHTSMQQSAAEVMRWLNSVQITRHSKWVTANNSTKTPRTPADTHRRKG
jgi:hypothetical protein